MPTRKKRTRTPLSAQITPKAVEAFTQALPHREHRKLQLMDSSSCPGRGRCEICDDYEQNVQVLHGLVGLHPSVPSPLDVFASDEPPPWFKRNKAEAWSKAVDMRKLLDKAAGLETPTTGMITDVTRAHINLRWIERVCMIPDGFDVGKPVRLRDFQREVICKIYSGGDLGLSDMPEEDVGRFKQFLESRFDLVGAGEGT